MMGFLVEFHTHGKLERGLNPSFVALIPKKEDAVNLQEFKPISLIWSAYKIIAKILSKRLCRVLDSIIS